MADSPETIDPSNSLCDLTDDPMIRLTLTLISRAAKGNFFGRTVRRGLEDTSFLPGDMVRVGLLELNETRLVFPFRFVCERVFMPKVLFVMSIGVSPPCCGRRRGDFRGELLVGVYILGGMIAMQGCTDLQ
jgi:hypothetical protein